MATLVFGAIGTALGGPLGGAIGALAGRQVDTLIFGGQTARGPRLKELEVTTSSYGTPLRRHFGRMRVPGTMIWATELVENSETQGGGKQQASVTLYSYTANFAVALASRPILGIGRIWADGRLLRGAEGDLKVAGSLRIHTGQPDQEPDPLIAAEVGPDRCPAFRGLAYVVFEALDLGEFYNRIPALTFEVIADESFTLADVLAGAIDDVDADVPLEDLVGLTCEGAIAETLAQIDPLYPISADAGGEVLTIDRERLQDTPLPLPEAATAVNDDAFGGATGFARSRLPGNEQPPSVLRYYDEQRDYLPGMQRAAIRVASGQPQAIEIPAAMTAETARSLIERTARKLDWSRDRVTWRTASLDPAIAPGTLVTLPGHAGIWRVTEWEWNDSGIELALARVAPTGADTAPGGAVDPGRTNPPADLPAPPTALVAFELPPMGTDAGDTPTVFAALSSGTANWSGAALYLDKGDGEMEPLGPSGRTRSLLGTTVDALPAANPLLFDRGSQVTVQLTANDLPLASASTRQLALGANLALIGTELIQFAEAVSLGSGLWILKGLLRGRAGTEAATLGHVIGEPFVLLNGRAITLEAARLASAPQANVLAVGRGDDEPVGSPIHLRGIGATPLCPVHPRARILPDGSLRLNWTRRARGAWRWSDLVDVPLREETERYRIEFGLPEAPVANWQSDIPQIDIAPGVLADLLTTTPSGLFQVRQQGIHGLSAPLLLFTPA